MKVLVAGASGLVGNAAVKAFAGLEGCEVIGVSRREPPPVPGATFLSVDLADAVQSANVLSDVRDVTHVVYAALWDGAHWTISEHDYTEGNLSMFRNFLEPVTATSPGLEHVSIVHGTKAYGTHLDELGRIRPRLLEHHPRSVFPSFYFLQEDYVRDRQKDSAWSWTVWRATWIFGEAPGNSMNAIPALGVYGALLKELGQPLAFPGNPDWRVVREACDAELLADAFVWATTTPRSANQIYNVSNGDQFDWQTVWPTIAAAMGMEVGESRRMCLEDEIPRRAEAWAAIVDKYELLAPSDPVDFCGPSFAFLDQLMGYYREPELRVQLTSTIKLRQHGFDACIDTEKMLTKWFSRLQDARMLPPTA